MTVKDYLVKATTQLTRAGIGTARLDALVLLEDVSGRDRAWLLAHNDHKISPPEFAELEKLLKQRSEHVPLAYVRGHTEFYGREFIISPAVLEPRPESETIIDLLKELSADGSLTQKGSDVLKIADVGTGSGALGITAKLELEKHIKVAVDLLEIDRDALKIAKTNVDKHTTGVTVTESDLLQNSSGGYGVLLCNLPYVPDGHTVNQAALREPSIAIFGGPDGLDLYRRLFKQLPTHSKRPLFILTESLPPQHEALTVIAECSGYSLNRSDDFIQVFRRIQTGGRKP